MVYFIDVAGKHRNILLDTNVPYISAAGRFSVQTESGKSLQTCFSVRQKSQHLTCYTMRGYYFSFHFFKLRYHLVHDNTTNTKNYKIQKSVQL